MLSRDKSGSFPLYALKHLDVIGLVRIPGTTCVVENRPHQRLVPQLLSLLRAPVKISPQEIQVTLGFGDCLVYMGIPAEGIVQFHSEVRVMTDMLKLLSLDGVRVLQRAFLPCDGQDVALRRIEIHLPVIRPSAKLVEVPLKFSSITCSIDHQSSANRRMLEPGLSVYIINV